MTRKRRRLSAEEERLWRKVADTATPIEKPARAMPPPLRKEPDRPVSKPAPPPPVPSFRIGEKAREPETRIAPPDHPVRMDRKKFGKLKRGKTRPEARIDLHGMTADTAHMALTAFLMRAKSDGKRLVLVITGKGRPSDDGDPIPRQTGVLRRQLPHWLDQPPLRQIVLQVTEAHQRHGGSGAFYVYLRR